MNSELQQLPLRAFVCAVIVIVASHSSRRYVDQTDLFVAKTYGKQVDNGGPPFVVSAASGVKSVVSLKKATLIAPHERTGPLYGK